MGIVEWKFIYIHYSLIDLTRIIVKMQLKTPGRNRTCGPAIPVQRYPTEVPRQGRSNRGGVAIPPPPNNCSCVMSGRFPVDFQVNSGNSLGIKKWILCSESELKLTIDQLKTTVGIKPAAFGIRYQPVLCQLSYEAKYSFLKIEILFIPLLANSHIFEMRPQ